MNNLMNKIVSMSAGNPGAAIALAELAKMGSADTIDKLHEYGIKGTDIYVLFSDLCDKNPLAVCLLVETCPKDILIDACSRQDRSGREVLRNWNPDHAVINQRS